MISFMVKKKKLLLFTVFALLQTAVITVFRGFLQSDMVL